VSSASPAALVREVDVAAAAARIRVWGEACEWSGWDPYDALNSPAAPAITLGTATGRRLFTQLVKRSPINLRPLVGIRPARNHKAIGLVASAYAALGSMADDDAAISAARWLDWLEAESVVAADEAAWAYHFDVQTRFFRYLAGSPNTIATAFVAHAFLDAVELLGDEARLETARRASRFLVRRMLVGDRGKPFFRYIPGDTKLIHNANLLACAVLVRTARLGGPAEFAEIAERSLQTTLAAQRPDGSWPYADGPGQGWVDNFHTGYVLESLAFCAELAGVRPALARGAVFWGQEMFLADGTPKYYPDRTYPLDAHCYATAIDTLLALPAGSPAPGVPVEAVAALLIRDMLRTDGSVVFQRHGHWANRVPFVRWSAAPSFRSLARLARTQAVGRPS
jgi:hypothetical protein